MALVQLADRDGANLIEPRLEPWGELVLAELGQDVVE